MAEQLSFDLPVRAAMGREDFMVAPSNALAVVMMDQTQAWALNKLVLCGPSGAGKTHLVHVWARETGAQIVNAKDLSEADVPELALGPVAVEDVPTIAQNMTQQTCLFHLHNEMQTTGQPLLLTGDGAPNLWGLTLPDLQSRVDGTSVATLDAPDDTLLTAVLAKHFYDRQLHPKTDVIPYLLARMDRSFAAARDIVRQLDQASLSEQRALTRTFAGRVLDKTL